MVFVNPRNHDWNHESTDNTLIKRVCYQKYLERAEEEGFEPFDFDWFCANDYEDKVMMKSLLPKETFQWYQEEHKEEVKMRKKLPKTEMKGVKLF